MIDQQQLVHTTLQYLYDDSKTGSLYIRIAQTITPQESGFLTQVKLWTSKGFCTIDGEFIVEVRDAQDADFNGAGDTKDIGNLLTSESIDPDSFSTGTGAEITVNFSTPTFITSGTQYSIVLKLINSTLCGERVAIWGSGSSVYASGKWWWKRDDHAYWTDAGMDVYFITDLSMNTLWYNVDCDIRSLSQALSDINGDIRVVSTHTVLRDIDSDIRSAQRVINDINADIRVSENYEKLYNIDSDIRVSELLLNDISCDIRTARAGEPTNILTNIDCDIRVISRQLYDIDCDIRCKQTPLKLYDLNCDIRCLPTPPPEAPPPTPGVAKSSPMATGLDGFRVYLDGAEITDVDVDSIKWQWTQNETPATASFRVVRKSDNFNETLEAIAQAITTNLPIEIKFDGVLKYYGYVITPNVENSGESVIVNCLDRKVKVQEELLDVSYGRKWETVEAGSITITNAGSIGEALTYILDELVSDGIISSYSGVPDGIVPEYQETQGMPAGTLITELLDLTGNYYWNITPAGVLEIYEANAGALKNLPIQEVDRQIYLYDVINYDFRLNDRSNLITIVEVNMGTESEEERASFRIATPTIVPAWDRSYDNIYNQFYGDSRAIQNLRLYGILPYYREQTEDEQEKRREVGRKWLISNWKDGSFIDNTFKPYVIGYNNYKISGWSWNGKYLNLANPLLEIKKSEEIEIEGDIPGWYIVYEYKIPKLIGRFYEKEAVSLATYPTIFDVTWNGVAGAGAKRKITLSQLGIRDNIAWTAYEEGQLVAKSEQGYNDTEYATDRANLILSRINDPITEGNVDLTFDAFDYYNLKLGNKINLTGTEEANIYNGNNGFPLDIQSIEFNAGSYIVTLNIKHLRNFKATKNFR